MNSVKLQDTKLIHINLSHFYTTMNDQKEKLRNNPIHYHIRKNKVIIMITIIIIIIINLSKEAENLHSENYKMLIKEIKDNKNR